MSKKDLDQSDQENSNLSDKTLEPSDENGGSEVSEKKEMDEKNSEISPEALPEDSAISDEKAEPNWEEDLQKKMNSKEMKQHLKKKKREERKEKIRQKKKELNEKTSELIEGQFMKIFDKRVLPYTILFIITAAFLGLILTIPFGDSINFLGKENITNFTQFLVITLAYSMIIASALLFALSRNEKIHDLLFVEGGFLIKIAINLFLLGIGFGICAFWWNIIDPLVQGKLDFFTFQSFFGMILALAFFGWNAFQIFFVKMSIENQAINAEAKFRIKNEDIENNKKQQKIKIRNYLIVFIPLFVHIVFVVLFILMDTAEFYSFLDTPPSFIEKFTPEYFYYNEWVTENAGTIPSDLSNFVIFLTYYFPAVWINYRPLLAVLIWTILVLILIIALTAKQISLYKLSRKNETPNIFSGTFFLIFFIFLYLKLFAIINTGIGMATPSGQSQPDNFLGQVVDWITSIVLMLITIFNLLRGFGKRVQARVGKAKITQFNLTFLMFLLVSTYWGGQWSLISSEGLTKEGLRIATGFIVVIVYVGFYYWYSGWILERRGFIRKQSFTLTETKEMMTELSLDIKENLLHTIENEEIVLNTLNQYMLEKKIILADGKDEDALVDSLEEQQEIKTATEKLSQMEIAYEDAQKEQKEYEEALTNLDQSKEELKRLNIQKTDLKAKVEKIPDNLDQELQSLRSSIADLENQIAEQQKKYNSVLKEFKNKKLPKEPKTPTTADGEVDEPLYAEFKANYEKELQQYNALQNQVEQEDKLLNQKEAKLTTQQQKLAELQNKIEETNQLKQEFSEIDDKVENCENTIKAIETDLDLLKTRAEMAKPLVEVAKTALDSAKVELKHFKRFSSAQELEKEAENKLTEAQKYHEMASEKFNEAESEINSTRSIPEIEESLQDLEEKIQKETQKVSQATETKDKKEFDFQKSKEDSEHAKDSFNNAKEALNQADNEIKDAEKELEKARNHLKKGEDIKADYENAKDEYRFAQEDVEKAMDLASAEAEVKKVEDQIKETKSDLKLEKKRDPVDQDQIDELNQKIEELEDILRNRKDDLKEVKDLHSKASQKLKRMQKLEEQLIDLEEAKSIVQTKEEKLKETEDNRFNPQKEVEQTKQDLNKAQDSYDEAKKELSVATAELKSEENKLSSLHNQKKLGHEELEARRIAEKNHKEAKEELDKASKLLNEANENYASYEESREKQETTYYLALKEAEIDYHIYVKEKELKEAHYTLKQAMRQAEANVKSREEMVKDAKDAKKEFLAEKEENPKKLAKSVRNEIIEVKSHPNS